MDNPFPPTDSGLTEKQIIRIILAVLLVIALAALVSYWLKPTGPYTAN